MKTTSKTTSVEGKKVRATFSITQITETEYRALIEALEAWKDPRKEKYLSMMKGILEDE